MKTKVKKLAVALFIGITCTSCAVDMFNKVSGNKNVVNEDRKVSTDFTRIEASNGLDVYITQDPQISVVVKADENLQEIIITEVEDGVLKVYSEKNIWSAKSKKVYVNIQNLSSIKASSGSDLRSENTIQADMISVNASSGASVRVSVSAKNVTTNSSSGSDIRIAGITDSHTAKASSGSAIRAYELINKNAIAKVSSGAGIDIYASEKIEARASSGGSIDYKGNPKKVNRNTSSGGSISDR